VKKYLLGYLFADADQLLKAILELLNKIEKRHCRRLFRVDGPVEKMSSPWYGSNGNTLFHRDDRRFNSVVVALPSCAHLGSLEFPPSGIGLTTQEMSSTIFLLMIIAKTLLQNPRLTSISRCIFIHAVHFRNTNLAYLCCMW
jgi:hypothetical protein